MRCSLNSSFVYFVLAVPSYDVLMRVSLTAEACVSLRLTLELFYLASCVALVFVISMLGLIKLLKTKRNKIVFGLTKEMALRWKQKVQTS